MDTVLLNEKNNACLTIPIYYDLNHVVRYAFATRYSFEIMRYTSIIYFGKKVNLRPFLSNLQEDWDYQKCCEKLPLFIYQQRWVYNITQSVTPLKIRI